MTKPSAPPNAPARIAISVGVIVLVAELLIVLLIDLFQPSFKSGSSFLWKVVDPVLLVAILSPALYYLVFKPLREQQTTLEKQLDALRQNEQLAALIEAIPDAVFLKDKDNRWQIINEPAKQLFQLHDLPWQGKTELELAALHPAFRAVHEAGLASDEQAWRHGGLSVGEERIIGKDGQYVIIETRKVPIVDRDGQRKGLVIIGRDITEHKRAEQELRIAATAFETREGILITDENKRIIRVNRAFTHLTGYSAAEAIGQTPAILRSERQDDAFYRGMWAAVSRDKYWQGEIWNRRKNGEIYPEWLTITAVTGADAQITNYVGMFSDITRYKEADEQMHQLVFYDPLTRLPNRRLLQDRLQQARTRSLRHKTRGAILFIDLDHFKALNDTHGHDVGDLLLIEIAKRLQDCVRSGDTVARLGGDEFVVVLGDLSDDIQLAASVAQEIGEKILTAINQPCHLNGPEYRSTSSIGINLFQGNEIAMEDLLKHADAAMYQAKTSGRNALRFFDPSMQQELAAHAALTQDLRQALSRQEFKLYYQTQIDERGVIGAEALLRWQHPVRGLIPPRDFIALAEETGLIVPIGAWVLQTACTQLKQWEGSPHTNQLQLSINISARQFRETDMVEQVLEILKETGIDPLKLKFELTESLIEENVSDSIDKMQRLRNAGIRFSVDDFGTGQASLTHLKRLPLDQIKIDESFIRDSATDPNDAAIIRTIIGMAANLGLGIIAEGVETEQQREFLERSGCRTFQGYLFGKPMPLKEFQNTLPDLPL